VGDSDSKMSNDQGMSGFFRNAINTSKSRAIEVLKIRPKSCQGCGP
jgi:hypothetical protein